MRHRSEAHKARCKCNTSHIWHKWQKVSYAHQHCIFVKKHSKTVKYYLISVFYCNIFFNIIYICDQSWIFSIITPAFSDIIYICDQSWIFSIITPAFSVTWSSEIILICWFAAYIDYFQCYINQHRYYQTVVLLHVFVGTQLKVWGKLDKNRRKKEILLFSRDALNWSKVTIKKNKYLINATLVSRWNFNVQKHLKIWIIPNLWPFFVNKIFHF